MTAPSSEAVREHLDDALYSNTMAADLGRALEMACTALPICDSNGILAIWRAMDARLEAVTVSIEKAIALGEVSP